MPEINFTEVASTAIAVCAVAAAVWPEPKNPTLKKVWRVVNFVGANFGKAKNKGANDA